MAAATEKCRKMAFKLGAPQYIMSDKGHAAGSRMREYGVFSDPLNPKTAISVECGYHGAKEAAEVAIHTAIRFLNVCGTINEKTAKRFLPEVSLPKQILVESTETITAETDNFKFADKFIGFEVIPRAGTVVAYDGINAIKTPYDDCVPIMPNHRVGHGSTALRLGRFVDVSV